MNIFFCSDLHIGHQKVAEIRMADHGGAIPDCMLDRLAQIHDKSLAFAWDRKVRKDDIVYVLGDISSGSTSGVKRALDWLKARPGRKRLITGNHDPIWPYHRDCHKWFPAFMDAFESVQAFGRVRIHLGEGYVTAWMSHFPFESDHSETPRFPEARLRDCGQYLLHGHTHDTSVLKPVQSSGDSCGRGRVESGTGIDGRDCGDYQRIGKRPVIIYCQNIHNNEVTVEVDGGELIIEVSDSWGYQSSRVPAKEFLEALQKGLS